MQNTNSDSPSKKDSIEIDYVTATANAITIVAALLTIMPFVSTHITYPAEATALFAPEQLKECVLESSSYNAEVSGYMATVTVKQRFRNPNKEKMSAEYKFPLSDNAAVSDMTMKIGDRTINADIKESGEARRIYDNARLHGQTATILDQVRTNIFSQSVANIAPGSSIDVTLKYTEMLPYAKGQFSLVFPTAIGARFIPIDFQGDSSRISLNAMNENSAPMHIDVSLNEGGMPITNVQSLTHQVQTNIVDGSQAKIAFDAVGGKDIVIDWKVVASEMQSGYLAHKDGQTGFVTAMIMPPQKVLSNQTAPKEMIFIVDCSGSQAGPPLNKAKDTLEYIVDHMNPKDTFQIMSFNNVVRKNTEKPEAVSASTKAKAHQFIKSLRADGGTVMAPAIKAACALPPQNNRLRIVSLMTDGFIGDDYSVIGLVKELRGNSRWFPFGTGNSVNRTLIDGVAKEGGGEPEYVLLNSPSQDIAKHFYERINSAVLTDVSLSCEGVKLSHLYPQKPSDVWENRPLYFQAQYEHGGKGTLLLKGMRQGKPYTQRIPIVLPEKESANGAIAPVWARARIDELMAQDWSGMQSGHASPEIKEDIVNTSIQNHVLSQFTSFVAVDSAAVQNAQDESQRIAEAAKSEAEKHREPLNLPMLKMPDDLNPSNMFRAALSQSYSNVVGQLNRLNTVTDANFSSEVSSRSAGAFAFDSSNAPTSAMMSAAPAPTVQASATTIQPPATPTIFRSAAPQYSGQFNTSNAPMLQGATNGTITGSGDQAQITGVNTSATVSVAPIAESNHNILALAQYAWLLLAAYTLCTLISNKKLSPRKQQALMLGCGLSILIAFNLTF